MSGEYIVKYEVDGCKGLPTSKQITIRPLPTVTAGNDTLLCKMSSSIWLTTGKPQGSVAYWHGKGVGNFNFLPNVAGVGVHPLTYVYTDTNGCTNSAIRNITVGPVLTAINESVCANNLPYALGGVTPTGGTWSGTAVTTAGVFTPANSPIGTQYLTYTATANGCSNSIVKQVTVKSTPATPYLTAQPRETVCAGSAVTLAPSTLIAGNIYKITGPNGFVAYRASTTLYNFTEAQKGLYTITASKDGCTNNPNANATRTLFFNPLPIVNAGLDEITCKYIPKLILKNTAPIGGIWSGEGYKKDTVLTNTSIDNPSGPSSFSSGGAPPPPLIKLTQDVFLPAGKIQGKAYTLTYTYTHPTTGCTNSDTKEIQIGGNPTVRIESSNNDTTCSNSPAYTDLAAIAENSYNYSYQWYKNGNPIAGATSPVIRTTAPARYGCVVNASCGMGYADYEVRKRLEWVKLAGNSTSCLGLTSDGRLLQWGSIPQYTICNGRLCVNKPHYTEVILPSLLNAENDWKEMATGNAASFGIKTNGTLWGWGGKNLNGELGIGDATIDFRAPQVFGITQVGIDTNWDKIATREYTTIALKKDCTMWGWGTTSNLILGTNGFYARRPVKQNILATFKEILILDSAIIAIHTNGSIWGWGQNKDGILNPSVNFNTVSTPQQLFTGNDWKKVVSNGKSTFAIKQNNILWSWGNNESGVLGLGDEVNRNLPIQVGTDADWAEVVVGSNFAFGKKTNKKLYVWGFNTKDTNLSGNILRLNMIRSLSNNILSPQYADIDNVSCLLADKAEYGLIGFNCDTTFCGIGKSVYGQLGGGQFLKMFFNFTCKNSSYEFIAREANKEEEFTDMNLFKSSDTYYLSNPSPNPVNADIATITYQIPEGTTGKIIVYDILKQLPLLERIASSSSNFSKVQLDVSHLANGVYPYSLVVDDKIVETKKMIIIR